MASGLLSCLSTRDLNHGHSLSTGSSIRAGALLEAGDHVHRELSVVADSDGNRRRGTLARHHSQYF